LILVNLIHINVCNLIAQVLMDSEDIDISVDDSSTDGPPVPMPEPMTDDFDIFQGDFISYSQLMSQMTLDPDAGTFGTQYEAPRALSYDTPGSST
jgi:hypothetical protein